MHIKININWIRVINFVVEGLLTGIASSLAGGVAAEILKSKGISTPEDLRKLVSHE